jgi:hypothetical protein
MGARSSKNGKAGLGTAKAVSCTPSTHRADLEFNNVRALIETGGNMWQDRALGNPAYEVPKTNDNSGPNAIFAGSLWMGGRSPDNQLKLAAVRFRQVGNDFWPGPLTNDGAATIDGTVCEQYDNTWGALRGDAELHRAVFQCMADPNCDEASEFPGYTTPSYFFDWPAEGDVFLGQDFYLAPFGDFDLSGDYDPESGDYPGYDLDGVIDCKSKFREDPIPLFGDSTIWWVFNDKGNAHTETGGQPIGMEIRSQAFAFSTNDQVNNMTFYNYTLINQGTQTLLNTYFGQWVDADLGNAQDDFVGCDVERGLGYCYNGDNNDESGTQPGYGVQPPAIGVDFFEGPFQDYDGLDNPLTTNVQDAIDSLGIPYAGIGIGYGDGVVDNERYGMRAFLYHNNSTGNPNTQDPQQAIDYYNFLRAIWKDNSPNYFGGTGHQSSSAADLSRPALYMFPGDSDPLFWGTQGLPTTFDWTEEQSMNAEGDRRFIQSAGPFTLEPGAYNNLTVGVVYARATGGGPFASVEELRIADDKAQSLFDNCFRILNGPDAPILRFQELDREVLLYLTNPSNSNNVNESYTEFDPTIPEEVVLPDSTIVPADRFYDFQGYQVYQLIDENVSVSEIDDIDKARLVYQGDVEDNVGQLINFINNPQLGLPVPTEMVNGSDAGIEHAIRITEDLFAQGSDLDLVNFKTYYYLAVAYGYNNWQDYNFNTGDGQPFPYIRGRKSPLGEIRSVAVIPHKPAPEMGGTVQNVGFGDGFEITRLEGEGNGNNDLDVKEEDIEGIVRNFPWFDQTITYEAGKGPINVRVVDPLNVPAGTFEIGLRDSITPNDLSDAYWFLVNTDNPSDTIWSDQTIEVENEQLLISGDRNLGISVSIQQYEYPSTDFTEPIDFDFEVKDPALAWYSGIPDVDGEQMLNWIRSGTAVEDGSSYNDYLNKDNDELYETFTAGTWAPWPLVGDTGVQPGAVSVFNTHNIADINECMSVEVVMTPDKDLWTRCPVLEIAEFGSEFGDNKLDMRSDESVDKNGNPDQTGTGMGWFPGYAVNLETGERLNMAFGEDSFWGGPTGRDMIWNPSDTLFTGALGQPIFGGGHWIYVFKNNQRGLGTSNHVPMYDEGAFIRDRLASNGSSDRIRVYRAVAWVGSAFKVLGTELLATETRVRLGIAKEYKKFSAEPYTGYTPAASESLNGGLPLYRFTTGEAATQTDILTVAEEACDLMNVVPNPYYAFSAYETGRLDNRVKFINLPRECTISIYNVSGTLVRQYRKDNDLTFLDWDLKNQNNVPIAGGMYICHIDAPGVCERVIKWFGALRPTDLQNF